MKNVGVLSSPLCNPPNGVSVAWLALSVIYDRAPHAMWAGGAVTNVSFEAIGGVQQRGSWPYPAGRQRTGASFSRRK